MNKIGFRLNSEELPAVPDQDETPVEDDEDQYSHPMFRKLLFFQFEKKAKQLAVDYIMYSNNYGDAQLEKLIELKKVVQMSMK